jgi:hypothetical protein
MKQAVYLPKRILSNFYLHPTRKKLFYPVGNVLCAKERFIHLEILLRTEPSKKTFYFVFKKKN